MTEVKLLGAWFSLYSYRVIWALKIKGIPYEYIEEDIFNKGPLLLQHNPVHRKVPVLIHDQKTVCESMVILEYIDETWPQNPLLPNDPYERAAARFWVKFAEDKGPKVWTIFLKNGEEQQKAIEDTLEMLKTMEHGLKGKRFFGGNKIGAVDIAFGWIAQWLGIIEDITGVKLLEEDMFPHLHDWIKNFKKEPVIKENLPDRDRMFIFYKGIREMLLPSA